MTDAMIFCAPCLLGVEGLAAEELRAMGAADVRAENGRVLFAGDEALLARANLNSRVAERVLILLGEFDARSFEELFQGARALPWEEFIGKEDAFPVTGSSLNSQLHSVPDCQAILKKAVVERLKSRYHLSWFPESGPVHRIRFRLMKDRVSLMLDTSGDPLYKRGYRTESNGAPMRETLAAALVQLGRVRPDGNFIDPFCGSGTLPIEAALYAKNIAPGRGRGFAAESWAQSHREIWRAERQRADALIRRDAPFRAAGYDIDPHCRELTLANARRAGVADCVSAAVRDIRDFDRSARYGCVVCNPPYGERLGDLQTARELYRRMGEVFARQPGWSYGIITPEEEFERIFGRRADKRRKLYNGMIRCQYYQYFK